MPSVVTFDAGQTLVELDLDFLARRLTERDVVVDPGALAAALPASWHRYDELVAAGAAHPWHALMESLLGGAGVRGDAVAPLVAWLWSEQPRANLWRKPIPGMIELARSLAARGIRVGVLSNSEGRLAELFDEVGISDPFAAIIDSGRLGIEKPDPRIFAAALSALGAPGASSSALHIGDSWPADVLGALTAGWRAIWFRTRGGLGNDGDVVPVVSSAAELGTVLSSYS